MTNTHRLLMVLLIAAVVAALTPPIAAAAGEGNNTTAATNATASARPVGLDLTPAFEVLGGLLLGGGGIYIYIRRGLGPGYQVFMDVVDDLKAAKTGDLSRADAEARVAQLAKDLLALYYAETGAPEPPAPPTPPSPPMDRAGD